MKLPSVNSKCSDAGAGASEIQALQAEISRLKKVLAQESLRADAFKELIDVAEKQFNISIRKKSWRQVVRNLHAKAPEHYRVAGLCRLFGVTKQAYYKYDENRLLERVAGEEFAVFYIRDVRKKNPGIGGLKLWHMYRSHPLGRDRFAGASGRTQSTGNRDREMKSTIISFSV